MTLPGQEIPEKPPKKKKKTKKKPEPIIKYQDEYEEEEEPEAIIEFEGKKSLKNKQKNYMKKIKLHLMMKLWIYWELLKILIKIKRKKKKKNQFIEGRNLNNDEKEFYLILFHRVHLYYFYKKMIFKEFQRKFSPIRPSKNFIMRNGEN